MAMRFKPNRKYNPQPCVVKDFVPHTTVKDGTTFVHHVYEEVHNDLPAYDDYTLESLLSAGVPLEPVNSIIIDGVSNSTLEEINNKLSNDKSE